MLIKRLTKRNSQATIIVMKKATPRRATSNEAFEKFRDLTRRLVAVPKKEIDKEAAKYERKKSKTNKK